LTSAGARLIFGSDWPAGPLDPRDTIDDALNAPSETPAAEGVPASARSLRSLIDSYTAEAAFASYDEHRKGKLAPGMLADMVIFSADIFRDPPRSLREAPVTVTIFDGKVVYRRPPTPASSN